MEFTEQQSHRSLLKLVKILLFVVALFIIGAALYTFFSIRIHARAALRDAKNVYAALQSADIEMYGEKKTIYNPINKNGLEDSVKEKVDALVDSEGTYRITGYSTRRHELTGMIYSDGNYIVTFQKRGVGTVWDVDYQLNVFTFDDLEVE